MSKSLLAFFWIALIAFPVLAQKTNDAHQTAAAKAAVAEIGARTNSLVRVKRLGKSKVNGSISEIREDDFDVVSSDNGSIGVVISIRYDEVKQIKGRGVDWGNAGAKATNDAHQTAAAKAAVAEIGARTNSLVRVKRLGKSKVNGSISEIREDDFDVVSSDNGSIGVVISIRYDEVKQIKGRGVDWGNVGAKATLFGLKAFKVMAVILKGVNPRLPP